MQSDLPEITLLVVNKNKQCNHSQHYLFQITTLLAFRSIFLLSGFSFPRTPCSSVLQLKLPILWLFQVSFSRNADEQGVRGKLKDLKEYFQIK